MMKKQVLLFVILLLVIPFALSQEEYRVTGTENGSYNQQRGLFHEGRSTSGTGVATLTDPVNAPLMADLDNDGIQEIIVLDGSEFKFFNSNTLTLVDSIATNMSGLFLRNYSTFIAFDIDDDNLTEIISADTGNQNILIIEYNGTNTIIEQSYRIPDTVSGGPFQGYDDGEMILSCKAVDDCLIVYAESQFNKLNQSIWGFKFSSTQKFTEIVIKNTPTVSSALCFSQMPRMTAIDYDKDGTVEYVYSYLEAIAGDNDVITIEYINIVGDQPISEQTITVPNSAIWDSGGSNCFAGTIYKQFTSPLVFNIDGGGAFETVIGFMIDPNEYKMRSYRSNGGLIRSYPNVLEADGEIVSNIMVADIFDDSGAVDFCVMGYQVTDNELDLLCASEQTTLFSLLGFFNISSEEFIFDYDAEGLADINDVGRNFWTPVIHSSNQDTATRSDEIITTYGVFDIDEDFPFISDLNLIHEASHQDGVVMILDAENNKFADMLIMTETNLWYINDNFVNTGGQITSWFMNPCREATWKINTSVEFRIKVEDIDGDDVSAKAILYQGTSNEQDSGWSVNTSTGTTFTFSDFLVNETTANGNLRLMGRDTGNPTNTDIIDIPFTVALNGVEFNDCTTEDTIALEEIEEEVIVVPEDETDVDDNAIRNAFLDIPTGNLGFDILWLLIMTAVIVAIVMSMPNVMGYSLSMLAMVFLLIIGVKLGFIGVGTLVIIVVMGIVAIGLWLGKIFTGVGANGNG